MTYGVKDNKCLEELNIPNISYGTELPADSEGEEGDIFLLIDEEEA